MTYAPFRIDASVSMTAVGFRREAITAEASILIRTPVLD
jgi:hypothetical protein